MSVLALYESLWDGISRVLNAPSCQILQVQKAVPGRRFCPLARAGTGSCTARPVPRPTSVQTSDWVQRQYNPPTGAPVAPVQRGVLNILLPNENGP
eukprot:2994283-Rhodomonas_salina.1